MTNDFKLLYVEDNKVVRDNFVEIFSRYFKDITTADNGREALEIYKKNNFDIAILDISIPEINGLSLATKIREMNRDIEIIMLTAYADQEKLLQAINLRLFSYLVKPIKQNELDITLKELISRLSKGSALELKNGYTWNIKIEKLYYNNSEVKITKNEISLVKFLSANSLRYYSACEIADEIFGDKKESDGKCNNTIQLISRFKKKMLNLCNKEHFFIDNIYGLGYKITS
ncbi:signal transduction response regulator [Sulfurimonas gotlandica GD1]|uniref:Signal transduction response regulator n=1 Tax=Sulfurimonas gotlandica (strain DSM 19862 / JCM 16533 / GD1) TaxID=929558 RepID=B6BNR9_SULGG|nr:response regulator [Sulfurimonas gotlandica]EDZ61178.1 two component transcriptional regulator, winged helix family, putative [Sulfurimonas gotlandica GD1]EHP28873.1 signal transduction response regulator [Sulfurimonas gotlandica GD1]